MSVAVRRPFPLKTGIAVVSAVTQVTPAMRRFTLTAAAFCEPGVELPGEILTLGWPNAGEPLVLPLPRDGWQFPGGRTGQHWRNFTVRATAPERCALDVDIFLHGDLGRASAWAGRAAAGDTVGFAGPRIHWEIDPQADWSLLVADETGQPALLAILESLPAGHHAIAIAEVDGPREIQDVETDAHTELHWVLRDGRAPGTTTLLLDAVRALELPAGAGQLWAGAESLAVRDIRRHLSLVRPGSVTSQALGYWRHRTPPADVS